MHRSLPPWAFVLLASLACQLLKFAIYGLANRQLTLRPLVTTNGLPSLYAVSFGCLSTLVLRTEGYQSPIFIATFVFSAIILHDAVRVQGSMDQGGRAALLVAQSMSHSRWLAQIRPLLGDRRHRPLHIAVGLTLGILAGLSWRPPPVAAELGHVAGVGLCCENAVAWGDDHGRETASGPHRIARPDLGVEPRRAG